MEKIKLTPKRKEIMELLNFNNLFDVVRYYPYRYDYYHNEKLSMAKHEQRVSFAGIIAKKPLIERISHNRIKTTVILKNEFQECQVIFFNKFKTTNFLIEGKQMIVIGKYNAFINQISASSFMMLDKPIEQKFVPVYSLPTDIKDQTYRSFVSFAIKQTLDYLDDLIPSDLILKYRLISLKEAIQAIHFPTDSESLRQANRYLKYEELLTFCLIGLTKRKMFEKYSAKSPKVIDPTILKDFTSKLPFSLTEDQKEAIREIISDIKSNVSMSRLLQGDVGSGKTIVAIFAMLANYSASYQGAIMAPTDILAKQHYQTISSYLEGLNINLALLVSSMKEKEKREVLEGLKNGSIDIVVGTHAIIQEGVCFAKLGLAIIDEQHRFGVKQRLELKAKGSNVDILYMSATPIPRTLASTVYMDMDVSTIETYPYKERIIETKYLETNSIKQIKKQILDYLKTNQKIYVVCPSIEKSTLDISNVKDIYHKWQNEFKDYNIALLHGKLDSEEKEKIMQDFASGNIQIVISTTVIEVGINILDANMMIIYNAERFGLAQIHQLRGRIARDGKKGYCYLLSNADNSEVFDRLSFIASTNNGFKISEYDLVHRGAGDMLGLAQSGKSPFIISSLLEDYNILKEARKDATMIINNYDKYQKINNHIFMIIHNNEKYVE